MIKPQPAGSSGVRTAAILLAVIAMLYLARQILIPLAFALTLALILTPAVVWLQKMRVGRVASVALVMIVTIAGVDCPVTFAGAAPGFVGLDQINCRVPQGLVVNVSATVLVSSGGRTSNAATIAVEE